MKWKQNPKSAYAAAKAKDECKQKMLVEKQFLDGRGLYARPRQHSKKGEKTNGKGN